MSSRVLIIEDDPVIRRFVRASLETEGCEVFEADCAERGLIEAGTRQPELLILDLGLPDRDGLDVIRDVRTWSRIPIIVLSARTQESEKVAALDAGADDYLVKPFGVPELLARVRAQVRRQASMAVGEQAVFGFGDVTVDMIQRRVTRAGEEVHLTPIEYRLLTVLMRGHGRVLTHRQLMMDAWGPGYAERTHYLRIYMKQLREKLEHSPAQPEYLLTETGVGYRLKN
ncbi:MULTISPECIES: two-component system response regulator KdpE [unclassified Uliginosibacterium]|uniref:two-component system response regulator KdpE n=1 Tax=unclassified Uliginosibacterium TaxID=2621521 RepID=UPI000C7E7F73|nr:MULTISPECIES: two-component system response regulator KdpE [unclassified Uliginosibacterium]MDO6385431.1 two-component system response regulator KdpE [Uliginosibacterium sp. 31-12]PLK47479.1 two-component system response regulator KdpE [Uliginosibacterium sp. TH139]